MTTYLNPDPVNRRLEIGATWNAHSAQRTGTNTESKLLLFTHAFEALRCIAFELRTHSMNEQSRVAIARLGARQDGVLRHHRRLPDGSLRDTVVYSVIEPEWPAVRGELLRRLGAGRSAGRAAPTPLLDPRAAVHPQAEDSSHRPQAAGCPWLLSVFDCMFYSWI